MVEDYLEVRHVYKKEILFMKLDKKAMIVTMLIIVISCAGLSGCGQSSQSEHSKLKPIDVILFEMNILHHEGVEYKIDFKNQKLLKFNYFLYDHVPRDVTAENEGYTFICELEEQKIETFTTDAEKTGLADWRGNYTNYNIMDGMRWIMTIYFSDGTQKKIEGSTKGFPDNWDDMMPVFAALTGEDIFR
jgi:hypothetical protein